MNARIDLMRGNTNFFNRCLQCRASLRPAASIRNFYTWCRCARK